MSRLGLPVVLGAVLWACGPRPPEGAPDVVVITVDTLRHDALEHPGFQGLADRGTTFTEASTPLPRTTPALASLMTGLLPAGHGSWEVGDPIHEGTTLAERFGAAGYRTLAVSGSGVAGPKQGLDKGFQAFVLLDDPRGPRAAAEALALLPDWRPEALRRPVFLWVHLTDPHFPYLPEEGPEAPLCRALGEAADADEIKRFEVFSDVGGRSSAALADCRLLYAAEAGASAAAIPALLAAFDDPVVALTSDHGESLGDWGLYYEHGPDVSSANVRVPLILAGPGVPAGVTDDRFAQLQDLTPTLLGLAGLETPAGLDGIGLFSQTSRKRASSVSASALHAHLPGYLRSGRAKRRNCTHLAPWALCTNGLFHHGEDPQHTEDRSEAEPEVVATLEAVAARWPAESARQLMVKDEEYKLVARPAADGYAFELRLRHDDTRVLEPSQPHVAEAIARLRGSLPEGPSGPGLPELSEEEEEVLRALGYVE